jgi:hypothetical protein
MVNSQLIEIICNEMTLIAGAEDIPPLKKIYAIGSGGL